MPATPASASKHYRRLQRLQAATIAALRRAWGRMDPAGNWERQYADDVGPKMLAIVVAAQLAAARESDSYVAEILNELAFGPETAPGVVNARRLAGVAGDGRPVESLLATSVGRARASATPEAPEVGLDSAQQFIDMIAQTLIEDAQRAAEVVAMTERPWVDGWVRMINPPCCSRCAILSGKFYLWNEGFARHPRCDCYHAPAPSDGAARDRLIAANSPDRYFDSLTEAEQNKVFTESGAEAIRLGADMSQVVNARRGMSRAQVISTTEGTTRRGLARSRMGNRATRLMPESILEIANGDRDEAIRLLRLYGYIT